MNSPAQNKASNFLVLRRSLLLIFLPLSLGLGIVMGVLHRMEIVADRRLVELNETRNVEVQKQGAIEHFKLARSDINILAAQNELGDFLENNKNNISSAEVARKGIAQEYLTLATQVRDLDQVRFLDINGQEIVRVNFNDGQPKIVEESSLQNQSSRYWFKEAMKLGRGEVFVSPLDLNIDQGKLTIPYKLVVRFATPVFDQQGQKRGIVVLNYLGKSIIDHLKNSTAIGTMLLVNNQGYWLKGRTPEEEWGFMIPERSDRTFAKEFPQAWQKISTTQSGQFFTAEGLFIFETFSPQLVSQNESKNLLGSVQQLAILTPPATNEWKIISFVPNSVLEQRLALARNRSLLLYLSLLGLGGVGAYFVSFSQVKRRIAEQDLRKSESRYQKLAANIPGMIYQVTLRPDGWAGFTYASQGCRDIYGLGPTELIAQNNIILERTHPEDVSSLQRAIAASAQTLETFIWDGRVVNPTDTKWVRAVSRPEKQTNGDIIWDGILIDITEMKTGELALRDLKAQLETKVVERTKELKQSELELRQKALDLEVALQQIHKSQSQLVQNEKMSSLGQLVAGIAHEINNPVNFVYGNLVHADRYTKEILELLSLYQKHYSPPAKTVKDFENEIEIDFIKDDLPKLLTSMKVGADRIQKIVLSLRNFSRMDESDIKEVDIHEGIDSTLMILQSRLKAKSDRPEISIKKNYDRLPLVECYAGQLNQVFMNVLSNAIDALEESSGIIKRKLQITINTKRIDYHRVEIKVIDNGNGIPESARAKLFDPFFTTKDVGKGTGLGLAISYQIVVDKHNGNLSFSSDLGQGTEFVIIIPVRQSFANDQVSA